MMLFIDTSSSERTTLYLVDKDVIRAHVWGSQRTQQETLHLELAKFLKKYKTPIKEISKLGVVVGPGSFSRVRTGVVTANTLAFALNVPVAGVVRDEDADWAPDFGAILKQKTKPSVEVYYNKAPNITKSKK